MTQRAYRCMRELLEILGAIVCRRVLAAALVIALPSHAQAQAPAQEANRSYAERLVDRLYEHGQISYFFDNEIRVIARQYTRATVYAGRINVNGPRSPSKLNLYVFHFGDDMPTFLRNNCNAFPLDAIILCDHALLDSIPTTPPIGLSAKDPVELPLMMQWIIGHEIGHVVFGDVASGFAAGDLVPPGGRVSEVRERDIEVRADRFAANGIGVHSPSTWIQLGSQLADAIFWEQDHAVDHLAARPVDTLRPDGAASAPAAADHGMVAVRRTYVFDVPRGAHPQLLVRLWNFLQVLKTQYATYPTSSVLAPDFDVETRVIDGSAASTAAPELFYRGFYLGTDFPAGERARAETQEALALWVRGRSELAGPLARRHCDSPRMDDEPWQTMKAVMCLLVADTSTRNAISLPDCSDMKPSDAGACIGLSLLVGNACVRTALGNSTRAVLCRNSDDSSARYRRWRAQSVKYVPSHRLLNWLLVSEYREVWRGEHGPSEEVDRWIVGATEANAKYGMQDIAVEMLREHLSNLIDGVARARVLELIAESEASMGDLSGAIADGRESASLLARFAPENALLRGDMLYLLGRYARENGVWLIGSTDAAGFAQTSTGKLPSDVHLNESVAFLLQAAEVYERGAAQLEGREGVASLREALQASHINALGGVIYSYNMRVDSRHKALELARSLSSELETLRASLEKTRDDFAETCEGPALENIGVAETADERGDAERALRALRRAVELMGDSKAGENPEPLRPLAYALYASGDRPAASAMAREFVSRWGKYTGKVIDPETGSLVHGQYVSLRDILESRTAAGRFAEEPEAPTAPHFMPSTTARESEKGTL